MMMMMMMSSKMDKNNQKVNDPRSRQSQQTVYLHLPDINRQDYAFGQQRLI